jgi:hypothetical protein
MSFGRRLRLFILGILLGSLVVWAFLFRGRTFPAWTPEGRVLEALQEQPIKISKHAACLLECFHISNNDVVEILRSADVIFSESSIRDKEIPEYVLEGKALDGKTHKLKFRSEYMSSYLITVINTPETIQTCACGE